MMLKTFFLYNAPFLRYLRFCVFRTRRKSTFSIITRQLLVVATWNNNRWIPLNELHKIDVQTFFVQCIMFEIFAILCFWTWSFLEEIHIFGHNSVFIGRSDLKQEPLDSSRQAGQKWMEFFRTMYRFWNIRVIVVFFIFYFFFYFFGRVSEKCGL